MRSVDTNVLVRLIARDDLRQSAAADLFIERGAWVSALALVETIWVLGSIYQLGHAALVTAIEMLLNHKNLTLQDADVAADALELFRSKPNLGFSDCMMLQLARKSRHVPLGTFDRNLARIEGTHGLQST